jgi:hypothetical protein
MSDPQEHSQSGSDPGRAGGPGTGPGAEAQRFWDEYARRTRPGGHREQRGRAGEPANGRGRGAEHSHECLEWCPICRTADLLRASASPEIRDQLQSLQHDALVTLRSLIDAYIDRVGDGPERRGAPVEDIPIE